MEHLKEEENIPLKTVLGKHPKLFKGGLEQKTGAKPYHAKPFEIPKAYEATNWKERKLGMLES